MTHVEFRKRLAALVREHVGAGDDPDKMAEAMSSCMIIVASVMRGRDPGARAEYLRVAEGAWTDAGPVVARAKGRREDRGGAA